MVSTVSVKRALAALATSTDTATRPYLAVIDEADAAREDLRRAAGFVDAVGLDRLAEAIEAADRDGRATVAERGRETLAEYRRFRAVASPDGNSGSVAADTGARDHFHRAPGTPKPDTGQGATE